MQLVHDDVWQVIVRGCQEHLSGSEAVRNALAFWREAYEPVFGLPLRPRVPEEEDEAPAKVPKAKNTKEDEEKVRRGCIFRLALLQ